MDPPMNASSKEIVFEKGTVVSYDSTDKIVMVKLGNSSNKYVPKMVLKRAAPPQSSYYNGFEDMVNMETLNDAELLNNIIVRFSQDLIFTYVGPTLLVVNPFKAIKDKIGLDV